MAVEVEAAGQVDEFLRVLRRRVWWIVIPAAVIGSLGVFFAVVVPKKYVSNTEVMVLNPGEATGEFGATAAAVEGQVAKYNIKSTKRIESVLLSLDWPDFEALDSRDRAEYVQARSEDLTVVQPNMPKGSQRQIVRLEYKDTNGDRAYTFLVELLNSWTEEVLNRHLNQKRKEKDDLADEMFTNERRQNEILEEQTRIRQENQIPPPMQSEIGVIEQQPVTFLDAAENERRISNLEQELFQNDDVLLELIAERDLLPPLLPGDGEGIPGDPIGRTIDSIDLKIAQAELEIDAGGWAPGHSSRTKLENDIRTLRKQRQELLLERDTSSFDPESEVKNPRRIELSDQIVRLERRVERDRRRLDGFKAQRSELRRATDGLNDAYTNLERLESEKRGLVDAHQVLKKRFDALKIQVSSLSDPSGNPFEILEDPIPPTKPTSPNPWLISIGSILFGLAAGLGLAVLLEYSRSCFRSARELSRVMPYPVLGSVNTIRTRRERAKGALVRTILAGGCIAFVVSVGFVTWAWAEDKRYEAEMGSSEAVDDSMAGEEGRSAGTPEVNRLNDFVERKIDQFRRLLM